MREIIPGIEYRQRYLQAFMTSLEIQDGSNQAEAGESGMRGGEKVCARNANLRLCFLCPAIPTNLCAPTTLCPSANTDFETVCYITRDILYAEIRVIVC